MRKFLYSRMHFLVFLLTLHGFLAQSVMLTAQQQQLPTIHIFVVYQNDPAIGSPKDKQSMETFTNPLREQTGSPVIVKFVDASAATTDYINQMLTNANIRSNDAVWYYYSGHGSNYDEWPQSAQKKVPLTWVHRRLKETHARLTIATYDCCSAGSPAVEPSPLAARILNLKVLFNESKGNIIAASGQSNSLSFGSNTSGGLFTNALLDGIKNKGTWEEVLSDAQSSTQRQAALLHRNQKPKYLIENPGINQILDAPSLTIRETDTIEKLVKSVQELINNSTPKKMVVTFEDLMRWNPGLTRENFDSYKGKVIKIDVEDTQLNEIKN